MAEALAVVKVGKTECGFLKLTPTSRTAAMAAALSRGTLKAPSPSRTKKKTLFGACAIATVGHAVRAKTSAASRFMIFSPLTWRHRGASRPNRSVELHSIALTIGDTEQLRLRPNANSIRRSKIDVGPKA